MKRTHYAGRQLDRLKDLCRQRRLTLTPDLVDTHRLVITDSNGDGVGEARFHRGSLTYARVRGEAFSAAHAGEAEAVLEQLLAALQPAPA